MEPMPNSPISFPGSYEGLYQEYNDSLDASSNDDANEEPDFLLIEGDNIIYVDDDTTVGGDGSEKNPYPPSKKLSIPLQINGVL